MLRQLFEAVGHSEWNEDPRFESVTALVGEGNFEALGALLAEAFLTKTVAESLAALTANDVPCGPILDADEAIANEQLVHNQAIEIWDHPDAGRVQQPRPAARFSETPAIFRKSASRRGEQTDEILAEIGRTPEQIQALRVGGHAGG
jgi:crotonobetainyl-CoA:carnitine CoA-transferase CaiB-like acyl-CoA transferase